MNSADLCLPEPRSLAAVSTELDLNVEAVVCIPTFRRPQHLQLTLDSLLRQVTSRRFAVVIVDNDMASKEGVGIATAFLNGKGLHGLCLVEPRQGNCYAINAAFETARTTFMSATSFLMIDDDEIASEHWLERMVSAVAATGADLVGGPVIPNFADIRSSGLAHHPAFRSAYDTSGPVPIIYGSGNCLITRGVFERLDDPTFDVNFNFLGGGDLDFFTRCRRLGMRFHWVADAIINETVPPGRVRSSWLALRGMRIGVINYRVEYKVARTLWSRAKLLAKILAIFPLSLFRAGVLYNAERRAIIALHPVAVAIGGALAVIGIELRPYKASKIKS